MPRSPDPDDPTTVCNCDECVAERTRDNDIGRYLNFASLLRTNPWGTILAQTVEPRDDGVTAKCPHCELERPAHDLAGTVVGRELCSNCRDEGTCSVCRLWLDPSGTWTEGAEGQRICERCMATLMIGRCEQCDRPWWRPTQVQLGNRRAFVCSDCTDNLSYCNACDTFDGCRCDDQRVHDYGWKPTPTFFKSSEESDKLGKFSDATLLYLGIELEVELGDVDEAKVLDRLQPWMKEIYVKHDGSLDRGLELVTHPMTWRYIQERRHEFAALFRDLAAMGVRSYDTPTCGLHVHHSRDTYTPMQLYKVQQLVCGYAAFTLKLSQRQAQRLDEYASLTAEAPHTYALKASSGRNTRPDSHRRRVAVNLENDDTVEYRMFRGTLRPSGFFKALEYTIAVHEYTANASPETCTEHDFRAWVAFRHRAFPCLAYFLQHGVNMPEQQFNQLGRDPRSVTPIKELVAA